MTIEPSEKRTHANKRVTFLLKVFFRWILCICWVKVFALLHLLVHKFLSLLLNELLKSEIIQKLGWVQNVQHYCRCWWISRVFCMFLVLVQINNFFSLVLFYSVIHRRREKKLISEIISIARWNRFQRAFNFQFVRCS